MCSCALKRRRSSSTLASPGADPRGNPIPMNQRMDWPAPTTAWMPLPYVQTMVAPGTSAPATVTHGGGRLGGTFLGYTAQGSAVGACRGVTASIAAGKGSRHVCLFMFRRPYTRAANLRFLSPWASAEDRIGSIPWSPLDARRTEGGPFK